ncbi:aconitate hydratase AcnA [Pseudovibrio flavus]|uniref:aconitate hydratase AcnA n=1 Tax=Pseudovibrio flavus TaxID=2529854 RepID=UPI0012BD62BD
MKRTKIAGTDYYGIDYKREISSGFGALPYSLRVLAENVSRQNDGKADIQKVVARQAGAVSFRPSRLLLQDMLGLALLVDVMAMRTKIAQEGGDPTRVDMTLPVDLVIDHSMTINHWADRLALSRNQQREFEVNKERFSFIKACEARFPNLRVIPPGGGIMHQVNIEYLATVVSKSAADEMLLTPDTNLGTDSHTTMVNGLGVLGWGIGGLEAEAIMFGEATSVNVPKVIGLELKGSLDNSVTATDLALHVAEKLRALGVVDCFVELFGSGYSSLSVADRATVTNMSPEYGSTSVFCPCDSNTIRYLRETGRNQTNTFLVEAYNRQQGLWFGENNRSIEFENTVEIDLGSIGRSVAGPSRPEQRIDLAKATSTLTSAEEKTAQRFPIGDSEDTIGDGDVIIAAITSCTNTANPRNMLLSGLLARNAVEKGLKVKPQVKTSLSPGSRVVAAYLEKSGLQTSLNALGFHIAAFSCSTCNGMSGPLSPELDETIRKNDVKGIAVLSGNRNFAGRIHPLASRNMIASPPLVVAYALLGTVTKDISSEPLGHDLEGQAVFLQDIWPDENEVNAMLSECLTPQDYSENYAEISKVNPRWNDLSVDDGTYDWQPSTYVTYPSFVGGLTRETTPLAPLEGLRPLAILGDSITTDHISPSGAITPTSDAGKFLLSKGIPETDFNSYGTRRGSMDIVVRSTFSNTRLLNEMVPGEEGAKTALQPDSKTVSMYEAIEAYQERGQSLIVIGGKEYGCGSSRDTAAKAPWLAGVRAVVVESFERIHRSNLVNMGIAPLCFPSGVTRKTLGLTGEEVFDIYFTHDLKSAKMVIYRDQEEPEAISLKLMLYNDAERNTFRHGGLLARSFRSFLGEET